MNEIIKAENSGHAKIIALLAEEIWNQHYTPIIGAAQVEYMLKNFNSYQNIDTDIRLGNFIYYIIYCGGEPAGYCAVRPEKDAIFLSKLYVRENFRKNGLGKAMLIHITSVFSDLKRIYLRVNRRNVNSVAAYQKIGFVITLSEDVDIGGGFINEDYVMSLKL